MTNSLVERYFQDRESKELLDDFIKLRYIKNIIEYIVKIMTVPGRPFLIRAPPGCGKTWAVKSLKEDPEFKGRILDVDDFSRYKNGKWLTRWETLEPFEDKIILGNCDNWYYGTDATTIAVDCRFPYHVMEERKYFKSGYVATKKQHNEIIYDSVKNSDYTVTFGKDGTYISDKSDNFVKVPYFSYLSLNVT